LKLIVAAESIIQHKGGFFIYDALKNKIEKQYVHNKNWEFRVGWRGCALYDKYLITTDWTDLHYFDLEKWKYIKTFKKNTFNDLHYLKIFKNKLYIVNTGLDAIEIFKNPLDPIFKDIQFIFKKNCIFKKRKINLEKKYNELFKIKPHSCHPNAIEISDDRIYVTCFQKEQQRNTGEIIELNTGNRVLDKNYDCHDALLYNGNLYTTRTRQNKIIVIYDINNRKLPISDIDEVFNIERGEWWRGMIIHDDILYLFSSDGYRGIKNTLTCLILDIKDKKIIQINKIPEFENILWDTAYQPQIMEI
jgi:hypothetical protein